VLRLIDIKANGVSHYAAGKEVLHGGKGTLQSLHLTG
jgi:hypothetical protein